MDIDITERKHAEEEIISSLREKEVLLKEIHHRVKNNLQLTTSLLNLQADNKRSLVLTEGFREANNRIYSMTLIHEQLYRSNIFSRIDMSHQLQVPASELCKTMSLPSGSARLAFDMEPTFCAIDTAIPCGPTVNEMVINALKFALPGGTGPGEISISIRRKGDDEIMLSVSDNGIGLPDHREPQNVKTLGIQPISILVRQFRGTYAIQPNGWT